MKKTLDGRAVGDRLIRLGIYPNMKGFGYTIDAVTNYSEGAQAMTIYSGIAKKNNTTAAGVERAIRHAKKKSEIFRDRPNMEFIALLRWELEKEVADAG